MKNFVGVRCLNSEDIKHQKCRYMGNTAILVGEGFDMNTPRGNYYFKTNPTPPYGLGTSHLRSYLRG